MCDAYPELHLKQHLKVHLKQHWQQNLKQQFETTSETTFETTLDINTCHVGFVLKNRHVMSALCYKGRRAILF